nr:MAG TPA: hypothetical protein [Caudoviricetes sp.]
MLFVVDILPAIKHIRCRFFIELRIVNVGVLSCCLVNGTKNIESILRILVYRLDIVSVFVPRKLVILFVIAIINDIYGYIHRCLLLSFHLDRDTVIFRGSMHHIGLPHLGTIIAGECTADHLERDFAIVVGVECNLVMLEPIASVCIITHAADLTSLLLIQSGQNAQAHRRLRSSNDNEDCGH